MSIYGRFLAALIALCLCAAGACALAEYDRNAPERLLPEHLYAQSALLVDEDSGEVLFAKNARVRMYPASTTKIMTLLLALESGIALDATVTIPAEAGDVPQGSSVIPVKPGDGMSFGDLLYGFMLSSGNDGANAIAVLVDGGIAPFVDRMNARAAELGCEGTHFVNAHGYHDADHYTTAQDLALMARAAMKNADFRRIVAAPAWTMHIRRDGKEVATEIVSRNSLLQSGDKYYYPDCTGIKTGHHNKAGWCFVGSAERDGKRVICVVLNCEEEVQKWYDAARLFEYGFTRYSPVTLEALAEACRERWGRAELEDADPNDEGGGVIDVSLIESQGGGQALQVVSGSPLSMDAAVERVLESTSVEWERPLIAPVEAGERLGRVTFEVEGAGVYTGVLVASRSVAARPTAVPATQVPSAPPPTRDAGQDAARPPRRRGSGLWVILALVALLAVACAAAFMATREQRRRARRRRRKRRR